MNQSMNVFVGASPVPLIDGRAACLLCFQWMELTRGCVAVGGGGKSKVAGFEALWRRRGSFDVIGGLGALRHRLSTAGCCRDLSNISNTGTQGLPIHLRPLSV